MSGRSEGVPMTARTAQRYLVGKTIEAVDAETIAPIAVGGDAVHSIAYLRLSDGSRIALRVVDADQLVGSSHWPHRYAVTMTRYSPRRKRPITDDPPPRTWDALAVAKRHIHLLTELTQVLRVEATARGEAEWERAKERIAELETGIEELTQ